MAKRVHQRVIALAVMAAALLPTLDGACQAPSAEPTESKAASGDWTPPPNGTVAELLQFIDGLIDRRPAGESEAEQIDHHRQVARSIAAAADKAVALKPTAEQAAPVHFYRLYALSVLQRFGEKDAAKRFEQALRLAQESKTPDVRSIGVKFLVESRMESWPTINEQEKRALIEGVVKYLKEGRVEDNDGMTIVTVADFLSQNDERELANQLLDATLPIFSKQGSKELASVVAMIKGVKRRVNLPGSELKLSGKLLDGSKLDWKQYEGKVVLIDFWASWCEPCRAELPNIQRLYRSYNDKGFEVVGICLDETPKQAAVAVHELKIPWATVFSHDEAKRVWNDPRAVELGVTGIPMAILLDQEHRVVHMNARGEALAKQLQLLLGMPLVQLDQRPARAIQQVIAEEANPQ